MDDFTKKRIEILKKRIAAMEKRVEVGIDKKYWQATLDRYNKYLTIIKAG